MPSKRWVEINGKGTADWSAITSREGGTPERQTYFGPHFCHSPPTITLTDAPVRRSCKAGICNTDIVPLASGTNTTSMKIKCRECASPLSCPVHHVGTTKPCPKCGTEIEIPTRANQLFQNSLWPLFAIGAVCLVYACMTNNVRPLLVYAVVFLVHMTIIGPFLAWGINLKSRGLWGFLVPSWIIGYVGVPVFFKVPWPYGPSLFVVVFVVGVVVMWRVFSQPADRTEVQQATETPTDRGCPIPGPVRSTCSDEVSYEDFVRYVVSDVLPEAQMRFRTAKTTMTAPTKTDCVDLAGLTAASFFLLARQALLRGKPDPTGSWKRIATALRANLPASGCSLASYERWVHRLCDHVDANPTINWNKNIGDCLWAATCPQCPNDNSSPSAVMLTYLWVFLDESRRWKFT